VRPQALDAARDDCARHGQVVEGAPQALRGQRAAGGERVRMLGLQAIERGVGGAQPIAQTELSKVLNHDALRRRFGKTASTTAHERRRGWCCCRLYARIATA